MLLYVRAFLRHFPYLFHQWKGLQWSEWIKVQRHIFMLLFLDEKLKIKKKSSTTIQSNHRQNKPNDVRLVFVGGGHAHVHVLREIGRLEEWKNCNVHVTLISKSNRTPYSGMFPGFVAGKYESYSDCTIDLIQLCNFSSIDFIEGQVVALNRATKQVSWINERDEIGPQTVQYDLLSIDIGSFPEPIDSDASLWEEGVLMAVKPLDLFHEKWNALLKQVKRIEKSVIKFVVVGGGAGGVELIMSMRVQLSKILDTDRIELVLVTRGDTLVPSHNVGVQRLLKQALSDRKIQVIYDSTVVSIDSNKYLQCENGSAIDFDFCFCCTRANGQNWLRESGLQVDDTGFVCVDSSLRSLNDESIFAAGDCATLVNSPCPKAGVFAVRQGFILEQNLRHAILGKDFKSYVPQNEFLGLIGTGDGDCIASKAEMALQGRWLWDLKIKIDTTWMWEYTDAIPC